MKRCVVFTFSSLLASVGFADTETPSSLATADLAEIDRKLNNPLTDIWSLTFQNNTGVHRGAALDGSEYSNNLFFQPFMPFEFGSRKQTMLTVRPVFPLDTQPLFEAADQRISSGHETGFGDLQSARGAGRDEDGALRLDSREAARRSALFAGKARRLRHGVELPSAVDSRDSESIQLTACNRKVSR